MYTATITPEVLEPWGVKVEVEVPDEVGRKFVIDVRKDEGGKLEANPPHEWGCVVYDGDAADAAKNFVAGSDMFSPADSFRAEIKAGYWVLVYLKEAAYDYRALVKGVVVLDPDGLLIKWQPSRSQG